MKVKQISIFLGNQEGMLQKVSALLGENNINIRAITIGESEGVGILRIVVNKPTDARMLLTQHGYVAQEIDIIALEVEDKPGGLADILHIFAENQLNIKYMYGFIEKFCGKALVAVCFNDNDRALQVMADNNLTF